jgi:cysteine desulfurase
MRIYLDHNATTPLHPAALEEMTRVLRDVPGNPSSTHQEGSEAKRVVERARQRIAALLGAEARELVFTGGATEANNLALAGLSSVLGERGRHIVSTAVEHPSVEEPLLRLEAQGFQVTRLGVDSDGRIDLGALERALRPDTGLVSVIWANNETGVLQDVDAIAECTHARGALLHVDATQAVGKVPVRVDRVPVDFLSTSAHKFGGPKGVGLLALRHPALPEALVRGGPQERRLRGGTHNVAGIAGFGAAAEAARGELDARVRRYAALRDRLWEGIEAKVPFVRRNGHPERVLPNTLNVEFCGAQGDVLLEILDLEGIAVSAGAACASGSIDPSSVLTAMGRSPEEARASLRFSVGEGNDEAQIDRVLAGLPDWVARTRPTGVATPAGAAK